MIYTGQEGGCTCGKVRFRLKAEPIAVNCCHCRDCQRLSGSAFAINVLIETELVELLGVEPVAAQLETPSGKGQANMRCPDCRVSVWSIYHAAGDGARFVRGGALDDTTVLEPTVHIHTSSKQGWVSIPDGAEQFPHFYGGKDIKRAFGEANAARWFEALGK